MSPSQMFCFLCGQTPKVGQKSRDTFLAENLRHFCVVSGYGASFCEHKVVFPSVFTCIDLHTQSVQTSGSKVALGWPSATSFRTVFIIWLQCLKIVDIPPPITSTKQFDFLLLASFQWYKYSHRQFSRLIYKCWIRKRRGHSVFSQVWKLTLSFMFGALMSSRQRSECWKTEGWWKGRWNIDTRVK